MDQTQDLLQVRVKEEAKGVLGTQFWAEIVEFLDKKETQNASLMEKTLLGTQDGIAVASKAQGKLELVRAIRLHINQLVTTGKARKI